MVIEKRKEVAKHYRHFALDICEKTKLSKAISMVRDTTFDASKLEDAEIWVMHLEGLIKQGLEAEDRSKCLSFFFTRRFEIVKKLAVLASLAGMQISDD